MLETGLQFGQGGFVETPAHGVKDEPSLRAHIVREPVVHPYTIPPVLEQTGVEKVTEVPGGF